MPVEVSLWTISQSANSNPVEIAGASPVSAVDQTVLRFDRLMRIAESASAAAADAPQPDGANWFRPWAGRLRAVHEQSSQLRHRLSATNAGRLARSGDDQLGLIEKRFEKWLEESTDLFGNADSSTATTLTSELPATNGDSESGRTTYYASQGAGEKLIAHTVEFPSTTWAAEFGAVIVLLLVGFAWSGRIAAVRDFLHRCPYVIGVCVGIGYWAWLSPSWFGLVVAAASACLALRFTWPGRFLRPEASTVLRSTRTS